MSRIPSDPDGGTCLGVLIAAATVVAVAATGGVLGWILLR